MQRFRCVATALSLFATLCFTFALAAADDAGFGVIKGTVTFTDGRPVAGSPIIIQVNGTRWNQQPLFTNDTGAYTCILPAGEITISVAGSRKIVTLAAGEQATVDHIIIRTGVFVSIAYGDHTIPDACDVCGAYKAPGDNAGQFLLGQNLGKGVYWFPSVPAAASAFAVTAHWQTRTGYTRNGPYTIFARHQWTFIKPETLRDVTLMLGNAVSLNVLVLGAGGKPAANTALKGSISYLTPGDHFWDDDAEGRNEPQELKDLKTDDDGVLALGSWPSNQYKLTLHADTMFGTPQIFTSGMDDEPAQILYTLDLPPRDVTQTLFTGDGQLAPHAAVTATYCWGSPMPISRCSSAISRIWTAMS